MVVRIKEYIKFYLMKMKVNCLDLKFLGLNEVIPVYWIPHKDGIVLIESGPGSTLTALENGLKVNGYSLEAITDVFVTHIHLDHAGSSGALARHGARIHVHPNGAPHLIDPEKLITSATRIYGKDMDRLWGDFLSVPEDKLSILEDGQEISINTLNFKALYTPGHSNHHISYLYEDICFTGDVGGSRLPGKNYISLPMPPPEFQLETWHETVDKLRKIGFRTIAPTHFGFFDDVPYHLDCLDRKLDEIDAWLVKTMSSNPDSEEFYHLFEEWTLKQYVEFNLSVDEQKIYESVNPTWMSPAGLQRYWKKFRTHENN